MKLVHVPSHSVGFALHGVAQQLAPTSQASSGLHTDRPAFRPAAFASTHLFVDAHQPHSWSIPPLAVQVRQSVNWSQKGAAESVSGVEETTTKEKNQIFSVFLSVSGSE
jgi:hypothetical protein